LGVYTRRKIAWQLGLSVKAIFSSRTLNNYLEVNVQGSVGKLFPLLEE